MKTSVRENLYKTLAVLVVLLVFICSSCTVSNEDIKRDPEPKDGEIKIYCVSPERDSLHWENVKLTGTDTELKINEVCNLLSEGPKEAGHVRAIADNVDIMSYKIGRDEQLEINFTAGYMQMDSITEALCRAAVVKTLCQIEGIKYVEFFVDGDPLTLNDRPAGLMGPDDFVDNSSDSYGFDQNVKIVVYYTDENGKMLREAILKVYIDGTKPLEEVVLEELIDGPLDTQTDMRNTINPDTKINRVRSYDGVCYVDFSEEFLSKLPGVTDDAAVYSVVNTLCELSGVTKVKITVSGTERKYFGKLPLNDFLSYRPELITIEKAGE
ncbi:MAG: GerMN domain-containing protein [Lachnospiraceae bacterium]|nr:GerMN domain-containing protein [Lachnospiraceae bacterium]